MNKLKTIFVYDLVLTSLQSGGVDQRLNFGSSSLSAAAPAPAATHETGASSFATTPSKSGGGGAGGSMQQQHQYGSNYDAQSAVDTNTVSQNVVSQLNSLNLNQTRMPTTVAAGGKFAGSFF